MQPQQLDDLVAEIRSIFGGGPIPLHRPVFEGSEKQLLAECVDSNFVSSIGEKVTELERRVADFTGARFGVAAVNGTNALQVALRLMGVERDCEVLTQALTFVVICKAIAHLGLGRGSRTWTALRWG